MQKQSPDTYLKQWRADSNPQKMESTLQHGSLPPKTYTIAQEEKICSYLDIPIQHCNDNILRRMNRRGNKEYLDKLLFVL